MRREDGWRKTWREEGTEKKRIFLLKARIVCFLAFRCQRERIGGRGEGRERGEKREGRERSGGGEGEGKEKRGAALRRTPGRRAVRVRGRAKKKQCTARAKRDLG